MKTTRWLFGLLALSVAAPAGAWNDHGHMTVAAAAWKDLTPRAKAEVTRLLQLNPQYGRWISNVPQARRAEVAFMRAATWPDSIRGSYIDDGYDPVEPIASQNLGYSDRYVHRYWHYRDTGFSPDGTPVQQTPDVNAVSRIKLFATTLADSSASDDVKSYDLSWLLHLVGDIHQPLHAAERYTASFRRGDSGGNGVKVCDGTASSCGTDNGLHSFWDGAIGNSRSPTSAIRKAGMLPPPDPDETRIDNPENWAQESFELAKQYAYADPVGTGDGPYRLTVSYHRTAGGVAEKRISLAGARLARMLNQIYR
jgi:hypothetical protein